MANGRGESSPYPTEATLARRRRLFTHKAFFRRENGAEMADKALEKAEPKKTTTRKKTTRKKAVKKEKTRLEKLKELELILQERMQFAEEKSLASLARQYRETLKEIEEIEGSQGEEDELSRILAE